MTRVSSKEEFELRKRRGRLFGMPRDACVAVRRG